MLGALISAGSSILGGILGNKSKDKEYQRQKEFAQSGIQWKVEDAKKAGIHPLYALGAGTTSYAPQSVGDSGVSQAGADIGRAIQSQQEPRGRTSAVTATAQRLELQNAALRNELLATQIAKLKQPGTGPGIAVDSSGDLIPGQPNANLSGVEVQPSQTTVVTPGVPYRQRGNVPDVQYAQTPTGGYWPFPAKHVKQGMEDVGPLEIEWWIRNSLMPMLGTNKSPWFVPPTEVPRNWRDEWYYAPFEGYKTRRRANNDAYTRMFMPGARR